MSAPLERLQAALTTRYRLVRELGAGGMATVYLAEDLKHERHVAIKLLRPELSAILGGDRFLNEIRVTAHLQHPHILQLYDSGEAEGLLFYVMPYVEGETLRDRLRRERQLAVDDAIDITRAVASALDYAHRHKVLHRDIKPENILLHEGQPLVADFGIALAVTAAAGNRLTETGLSLGTPHYMSPEQATGERALDGRTDIYSLACVTYEMLAGRPPHDGPTSQSVIAKILTETPPRLTLARPNVPPHVEAAISRALEKLAADRFHTAHEFAEALIHPTAAAMAATAPHAVAATTAWWRDWRKLALPAAGLVAGVALAQLWRSPPAPPGPLARFAVSTEGARIGPIPAPLVGLSPDGSMLAFAAQNPRGGDRQLFVRALGSFEVKPLVGALGVAPMFSPDGRWIAYDGGNGGVSKVPGGGGAPVTVGATGFHFAWDERGIIAVVDSGKVVRYPDRGGPPEVLIPAQPLRAFGGNVPWAILPGPRAVLTVVSDSGVSGRLVAIMIPDLERRTIIESGVAGALFSPSGHLVWVQTDGNLMAAPFDAGGMRITDQPTTLAQRVWITIGNIPQFAVAAGTIAYIPEALSDLAMVDRQGAARLVSTVPRAYHSPRLSPNGRRIAMDFISQGVRDVWVQDLADGTLSRLSFERTGHDPVWTPDGRRVAFIANRGALDQVFWTSADGSGVAEALAVAEISQATGAFTPDGRRFLTLTTPLAGQWDITAVDVAGDRKPRPFLAAPFNEYYPAISPDGRWLAYTSDESGQDEVYVRAFGGGGGRIQISLDGASEPVWARTGRELFYRRTVQGGGHLMVAAVATAPVFRVVSRTELFPADEYDTAIPHANYDVHPDGRRFIMVRRGRATEIVVIQNWQEELRKR